MSVYNSEGGTGGDLRDTGIDDQHASLQTPYRQDHRVFGDEDPFAASDPFRMRLRCQILDVLLSHQIRPSAGGDLVQRHTQYRVPHYREDHDIVVRLQVSYPESFNARGAAGVSGQL